MFWVGGVPALLAFYIRFRVKESVAWKQHRAPTWGDPADGKRPLEDFFVLSPVDDADDVSVPWNPGSLPALFERSPSAAPATISYVAILYNVAAVVGACCFGYISERYGRRLAILCSLGVALVAIPAWAFGGSLGTLVMGACLMQLGVQGAGESFRRI